jgi:hypothetical protein
MYYNFDIRSSYIYGEADYLCSNCRQYFLFAGSCIQYLGLHFNASPSYQPLAHYSHVSNIVEEWHISRTCTWKGWPARREKDKACAACVCMGAQTRRSCGCSSGLPVEHRRQRACGEFLMHDIFRFEGLVWGTFLVSNCLIEEHVSVETISLPLFKTTTSE